MGRELKRVPLDFDWPPKEVWKGYLNPHWESSRPCPACEGTGSSFRARALFDLWYGKRYFSPEMTDSKPFEPDDPFVLEFIRPKVERDADFYRQYLGADDLDTAVAREAKRMCDHWNSAWGHHLSDDDVEALIEANRLWDFTRRPLSPDQETHPNGWTKEWNGYTPTAAEVNRWSIRTIGHDSGNAYVCVCARCERDGYSSTCDSCGGDGTLWPDAATKQMYEDWEPTEPPKGGGWQVWETVSEGSPISPVFATAVDLQNWLIHQGYSKGAAEQFTSVGWTPSLVSTGSGIYKDIESLNIPKD